MLKHTLRRHLVPLSALWVFAAITNCALPVAAQTAQPMPEIPGVIHKVTKTYERLEMTVNSSKRLVLDQKIPEAQVNNPDVVELHPLAPNEIQVFAKAPGVTQVNLWGEDKKIYTVDVIVYADARELELLLQNQFPNASLKVIPVNNGVLISGYVDQPEHIDLIVRIAEEYYPKVINALRVSGVHQILLHVKVMEVSRTKLRRVGFDWAKFTGSNSAISSISGLLSHGDAGELLVSNDATFDFAVINGSNSFFGVLEALREDKLAKILAEPNLVAVSGRPAYFRVGGEYGYQVNGGITGPTVEFKQYGTRIDYVAIALGNGRIRLEVRPTVSEIDAANSVEGIPALKVREVDTGVELNAGQTLAIAGLVQNRIDSQFRGIPWVSEVPYVGALFRRVEEDNNEVELLIMVTPELVEALDANEVPPCGPGTMTASPSDCELYLKGHLEVPRCCPGSPGLGTATDMPPQGMMLQEREDIAVPHPATTDSSSWQRGYRGPVARSAQNPYSRYSQQRTPNVSPAKATKKEVGFIGPFGYDVVE